MIHLVTSNKLDIQSIKQYNDNFILCHAREKQVIPFSSGTTEFKFTVYYQDGTEVEEYNQMPNFKFEYIPVNSITTALEMISEDIVYESKNLWDETMIAVACDIQWNQQAAKFLNNELKEQDFETDCLNLYRYLGIADMNKLVSALKTALQSEFIYPDDPVAFGFSLMKVLSGGLL